MIKISMNVNERTVEEIVDNMPKDFKWKLMRKLERQSLREKWQSVFNIINKNLAKHPVSQKEINEEIKSYRKERNAKSRH